MHPPKVLIVNDDVHSAVALKSVLLESAEREDFEIVLAYSGEEALRHILRNEFAVVLLDVKMPVMDGFETADAIHSHPRLTSLPIIFITAHYDEELYRLYGYQKGAVDYVFMPVNPKILQTKVSVFVQMARQKLALQTQNQELHSINDNLRVRRVVDQAGMDSSAQIDAHAAADTTTNPTQQDLYKPPGRDLLTGLPNQQLILDHLEYTVSYSFRYQGNFALMVLGLRQVSNIDNDNEVEIGNALLQQVAECIKDAVRASDIVGRFRGNEFMVLLKGVAGLNEAQQVAEKLTQSLHQVEKIAGQSVALTAKIGIALYPQDGTSAQDLIHAAYQVMDQHKQYAIDEGLD